MCFICFVIIDILSYYISTQFVVMLNYIKLHIIKNLFLKTNKYTIFRKFKAEHAQFYYIMRNKSIF